MSGRERARRVAGRLSPRDLAILQSLQAMRFMTGAQLGRLHVIGATPETGARKTRAVLHRLAALALVVRLQRRIGGVRAGSAGLIFGLSGLGHAVLELGTGSNRRHRRVSEAKPAFQDHTLAVAEAYVRLVEHCRSSETQMLEFIAEPACWRRFSGMAGELVTLKPDAFVRLGVCGYEISAFLEVDLDTESLPTIVRKLRVYRSYWHTGTEQQHYGVFPKVWWLVPGTARQNTIARAIKQLPDEEQELFAVCLFTEATNLLTQVPTEGGAR